MTAVSKFMFKGFTLRPAGNNGDLKTATEWTQADRWHRLTTRGDFWIEQDKGIDSYVLEDKAGPVFFFKMEARPNGEVEIHIQFAPTPHDTQVRARERARLVDGLVLGFEWLERVLVLNQVRSIYFQSKSPSLVRFCKEQLGFRQSGERLDKVIASPMAQGN